MMNQELRLKIWSGVLIVGFFVLGFFSLATIVFVSSRSRMSVAFVP